MNKFFLSLYLFIGSILLVSCSSGTIYSELFNTMSSLLTEPKDIPLEKINSVSFASMQARIGRSKNSLIVLEEERDNILKWTSSNNIKIYTLNGYVIRLSGLENELENIELDRKHPVLTKNFTFEKVNLTSFYSFDNPRLINLPIKTEMYFDRDDFIYLQGVKIKVRIFIEKTKQNLISWKFENELWVNDEGEILKSIQSFTPKNPKIYTLLTKKYKKPE